MLTTHDPLILSMKNVEINYSEIEKPWIHLEIDCNYPEAKKDSKVEFTNITIKGNQGIVKLVKGNWVGNWTVNNLRLQDQKGCSLSS